MRTTVALDDDLMERAQAGSGRAERSALLGGSQPQLVAPPRRRPDPA
jgi:hypothetical protein